MNPETQRQIMYAEHDARWTPLIHDPKGRVMRVPSRKELVALLKTVAGVTQSVYSKGMPSQEPDFSTNPGPGATWCRHCRTWIPAGMGNVQRKGDRASTAVYRLLCPYCEEVISSEE
jgi:hypothetical protein